MVWMLLQSPVWSECKSAPHRLPFCSKHSEMCEIFNIPKKRSRKAAVVVYVTVILSAALFPESCSTKKTLEYSVINVLVKGLT